MKRLVFWALVGLVGCSQSSPNSTAGAGLQQAPPGAIPMVGTSAGRIALEVDLFRPLFPTAQGNFFAFESRALFFEGRSPFDLFDSVYIGQTITNQAELVSVPSDRIDEFANDHSRDGSMAANARRVAFLSRATNLIFDNRFLDGSWQLYVRDRAAGITHHASRNEQGFPANDDIQLAHMASAGRFVVFATQATNLAGDLLPPNTSGRGLTQLYLFDVDRLSNTLITRSLDAFGANGHSTSPYITTEGRWVVFRTNASNLKGFTDGSDPTNTVDTVDNNNMTDIYLLDRTTEQFFLISKGVNSTGPLFDVGIPAPLPNGRQVNDTPGISQDGRYVVFSALDNSGFRQIYLVDRAAPGAVPTLISGPANGNCRNPSISTRGFFITYETDATNLGAGPADTLGFTDIAVYNNRAGSPGFQTTAILSRNAASGFGNGDSLDPSFTGDGQAIAFATKATNLAVLQDTDPIQTAFSDVLILRNPFPNP